MKKLLIILAIFSCMKVGQGQEITKQIFSYSFSSRTIYEVTTKEGSVYYKFVFRDDRYVPARFYETIYFKDFETLHSFFRDLDSLYKKYDPSDKESISLTLHNNDVSITKIMGGKYIYIYSKDNGYFAMNAISLKKTNNFLNKYSKSKK